MPDLILQNVPQELFDRLQKAAAEHRHSVADEALQWLKMRRHLPDEPFLTEEIPAPFNLPLPGEGIKVSAVRRGGEHLPDPPWFIAETE